jgi:OsmC-like protein
MDRAGLHDAPNPGELLCAAVTSTLSCSSSIRRRLAIMRTVSSKHEASGKVDVRGALAIDTSVPVGFQTMATSVRIRAANGMPPQLLEQLCAASERLCIDLQTLRHGVNVNVAFDAQPVELLPSDALGGGEQHLIASRGSD